MWIMIPSLELLKLLWRVPGLRFRPIAPFSRRTRASWSFIASLGQIVAGHRDTRVLNIDFFRRKPALGIPQPIRAGVEESSNGGFQGAHPLHWLVVEKQNAALSL